MSEIHTLAMTAMKEKGTADALDLRGRAADYKLVQPYDGASWPDQCPADLPALWSICHTKDPAKAKPYQAPDGRSGMYMLDECCTQEGHVWRSVIDDNVWPPSGYPDGWEDLGVPGE